MLLSVSRTCRAVADSSVNSLQNRSCAAVLVFVHPPCMEPLCE